MRIDPPQRLFNWFGYNLAVLWAVILALFLGWLFLGWILYGGDPEASFSVDLLTVLLFGLIGGFCLALASTVGGFLYLALLAPFRNSGSSRRRRLVALAACPFVAGPLWYWAWTDHYADHALPLYIGTICIAYGLTVRFPRDRERRPSAARPVVVLD